MNTSQHAPKGRRRMMILLWIVLGTLVAVVALVFIVGMFLPERYEGRVAVTLNRPAEEVWTALADYQRNPVSGAMAKKTEPQPDVNGLPAWVEDMGSSQIDVTTDAATAPTHLKRRLADRVVPMTAAVEYRLEPTASGCRLTIVNQTTLRNGTWHVPIFRVLISLTNGIEKGLRDYSQRLAEGLGTKAVFE